MAEILYTESYNKKAAGFLRVHPEMRSQYAKTLRLLEINPFHPSLRLNKLKGRLQEMYSVSINIASRIIPYFRAKKTQIIPVEIRLHDDIYRE